MYNKFKFINYNYNNNFIEIVGSNEFYLIINKQILLDSIYDKNIVNLFLKKISMTTGNIIND